MNDADRTILDHFIDIRAKTTAMLNAVPEEMLARTAKGECHPLCWQFSHIANGVDWWMNFVMQDGRGWSGEQPSAKDAISAELDRSGGRLAAFFSADDGEPMARTFRLSEEKLPEKGVVEWVGRSRVLYLTAHELHHLARAELALWQWGIDELPDFP